MIVTAANGQQWDTVAGAYVPGPATGTPAPAGAGVDYAAQRALDAAQAAANLGGSQQAVQAAQQQLNNMQSLPGSAPSAPADPGPSAGDSAMAAYYANRTALDNAAAAQAAADRAARIQSIIAAVTGVFNSYGMSSIVPLITQYAQQGLSADAIGILVRSSPEYAQRFPAMSALTAKGHAITEGEYIAYEKSAAGLERQYGLPTGMLTSSVTNLLTNEVSAAEMADRVQLASVGAIQAPADFKLQMQQRFGIDQGGLIAHYLDPTVAEPLLQKQYAMAVLGTEASRANVDGISTDYLALLQNEGVSQQQAHQAFGTVAGQGGLTVGKGDVASTDQLVQAQFGTDASASAAVERTVKAKVGQFQGGGGFSQDRTGSNRGLGVSSTG